MPDGSVLVAEASLARIELQVKGAFRRGGRRAVFNVADLSLYSYVLSLQKGTPFHSRAIRSIEHCCAILS